MKKVNLLIYLGIKFKPIIIKFIPLEQLRLYKKRIVQKKLDKLKKQGIKKFVADRNKLGINLISSIQGDFGLGQSSRLIANVLEKANVEYSIYNFCTSKLNNMNEHEFDSKISKTLPYNINLIHINPMEMEMLYLEMNKSSWDYKYNIAFWLWELEEFPDDWIKYTELLDEIWTPSEFVSKSIRKKVNLPVKTIPYYISIKTKEGCNRKFFGIPDGKFLYLTMYDSLSVRQRKNPEGVLQAFKLAFTNSDKNIGLVIKVNNAAEEDIRVIHDTMYGYDNVYILLDNFSKNEVNSLLNVVDVFVSLHRAEGFGLVLAEAMLLGIPTIATNWSANTEFMNKEIACMVDYELVKLEKDIGPYEKGQRWAEADISEAASYMKQLYENKEYYNHIGQSAKDYVSYKLSFENASTLIKGRIDIIVNKHSGTLKEKADE